MSGPSFDGFPSHTHEPCVTWLPKAESVWLEHSHSAPTLPLPKNEKEIKIKLFICAFIKIEQPAYWWRIYIISTSLYSFLRLQPKSFWLLSIPKGQYPSVLWPPRGPRMELGWVYGKNLLYNKTVQTKLLHPLFVVSISRTYRKWMKICSSLERSTPKLHLEGKQKGESAGSGPQCYWEVTRLHRHPAINLLPLA